MHSKFLAKTMNLKRAYFYLFYKLYKFSEAAPSRWMSDWKAGVIVDVLLYFLQLSFLVYYKTFFNRYFELGDSRIAASIFVLIVVIPNYFIFHHKDQWKVYVREFDKWPRKKNTIGGIIVWAIIFIIIANLIFAFRLMSQIDWTQYR